MGGRSRIIPLPTPDDTYRFGKSAALLLPPNSILSLSGPLGAGKTTFVQGLAAGLLIETPVQSPTFTYLHLYDEGKKPLAHFDLYRMKTPSDFFSMGFEEYLDREGIAAIEWPERLGTALLAHSLSLRFSYTPEGRSVEFSSPIDSELIDLLSEWD